MGFAFANTHFLGLPFQPSIPVHVSGVRRAQKNTSNRNLFKQHPLSWTHRTQLFYGCTVYCRTATAQTDSGIDANHASGEQTRSKCSVRTPSFSPYNREKVSPILLGFIRKWSFRSLGQFEIWLCFLAVQPWACSSASPGVPSGTFLLSER